jgi:hypothetical protein
MRDERSFLRVARVVVCLVGFLAAGIEPVRAASVHEMTLTAADGAAGDALGRDVALAGDTLVAGANGDDDRGQDAGAAYVYLRNGQGWQLQTKLIPPELKPATSSAGPWT